MSQFSLPTGKIAHFFKGSNGLSVYVVPMSGADVFTFQAWVGVGSRHEKSDPDLNQTGLAHLFEHMMFRGTQNVPDGEFDRRLTENGVHDFNATTWNDRTNYYESLPSAQLNLVLELESDRMMNLKVDKDLLDTERGAVLSEFQMYQDDPEMVLEEKLYEEAFQSHPYRYTVLGTPQEIENFSVEDARLFYRRYYTPENTTLILLGSLDPQKTFDRAEHYFGAWKSSKSQRPRVDVEQEPPKTDEKIVKWTHPQLEQNKLIMGYPSPSPSQKSYPAAWVLQAHLSEGKASVMTQIWKDQKKVSDCSGDIDFFHDPGLMSFSADLQDEVDFSELTSSFDQAVDEIQKNGISDSDLKRAKNLILLEHAQQWETRQGLGSFMGESLSAMGNVLAGFECVQKLEAVTSDGVREAAQKILQVSQRTVIHAHCPTGEPS